MLTRPAPQPGAEARLVAGPHPAAGVLAADPVPAVLNRPAPQPGAEAGVVATSHPAVGVLAANGAPRPAPDPGAELLVRLAEAGAPPAWPMLPSREPEPGVATVLADPRGLRRIIAQHNRWRTVWTADDVLEACYALSLAHLAPPRSALLAEGFPLRLPVAARVLPPAPDAPEATPPPEPETEIAEPAPPRVRGPVSAVFPRQRPIRQVPWGLVVVLTLLVTIGVIAAVFVAQVFHGG
ncbi:hypothetical protein ACIOD2_03275 [Amycolatopsis sp. NPDC088138]|uniref:hypothetical protein n=1 Tax=Amycolatopsis sp. NPDC088138 TaxID=3363938 RepID=UPI0037F2CB71